MKNKLFIFLIVFLSLLVLGLGGFIVYDKFVKPDEEVSNCDDSCKNNDKVANNDSVVDDNNTTNSNDGNCDNFDDDIKQDIYIDDDIKQEIIDIYIDENVKMDTSHYYYNNNMHKDVSLVYNISSDDFELQIEHDGDYLIFKIVDYGDVYEYVVKIFSPDREMLYTLQKYNEYLFVQMACACGLPSLYYTINMNSHELSETTCVPEANGTCSGILFEEIYDEVEDNYNEVSYNMNYNSGKFSKNRVNKFSCGDYKKYDYWGNGDPIPNDTNDVETCKDDTCQRRVDFCYPRYT